MSKKAADGFEIYFTEKIWEMIPSIYRHEDGRAKNPGVLRALVELIAGQAAVLRRSHDRLWEDQFIDYCNDWVVPYIADLLGTRLVSAQNLRGRRVDTAKTIYYRRRKGTPRILEELIGDITGWEGKLTENFRRLGRTRHGLDPHPAPSAGLFSGTMPGGWADLRRQGASELAGGPFCEYHYTPDMRRHNGVDGRYAIPKLAFFLYRLKAFRVGDVTPFSRTGGGFTFDPSGRDVPLFTRRDRPDDREEWYSAREWELPAPMRCRMLDHALNNDINLVPGSFSVKEDAVEIIKNDVRAADLGKWDAGAVTGKLAVDPAKGRLMFTGEPPEKVKVTYHYGFSAGIGAGTYHRPGVETGTPGSDVSGGGGLSAAALLNDGITQINDSATYDSIGSKMAVTNTLLRAAGGERPYIRLNGNWVLNTGANKNSLLILDGLWIGSAGDHEIILRGNYEKVIIRHCTIDPGEKYGSDVNGDPIHAVPLVIDGYVEHLEIAASITGPIKMAGNGILERLSVRDSIIQSTGTGPALNILPGSVVESERVTVLGAVTVHRLWASDTLITGQVDVTDTQDGCFRFSAAPRGSRLPKPYESYMIDDSRHYFTSRSFGRPGYGQLSETVPVEIERGGENGAEIGAFNSLLNPVKMDGLEAKVNEYMPFGRIPIYIKKKPKRR